MTDPVARVAAWLKKQGYPLEYETARAAQSVGFRAWQGMHYLDDEGAARRTREIDVVAREWPLGEKHPSLHIELVFEAKHSHEPWLILTTQLPITDREHVLRDVFLHVADETPLKAIARGAAPPELLRIPDRHGFNIVQTVDDRDPTRPNSAYGAMASVTKAAHARFSLWKRHHNVVVFPVIVLGGALVELGYGEDGEQILRTVTHQRVRWQGSTVADEARIIDVVQRDHLREWLASARIATRQMADAYRGGPAPTAG